MLDWSWSDVEGRVCLSVARWTERNCKSKIGMWTWTNTKYPTSTCLFGWL